MDLTFFDRARAALAKAVNLDEVKILRDKAEALRIYARQTKDAVGMERQCAIIRLRAERRIGELLAKTVKRGNPKLRSELQLSPDVTIGLGKLGISRNQSAKWQKASTLPAALFERYVSTGHPTTAGVLKLVQDEERKQPGPRSGGNILTGPASRLWQDLDDDSVDLFLTDPPYATVDCYHELAELAAAKLKPGGLCLAACGNGYLPQVLEAMGKHLDYHWTFCVRFSGPHRAVWPKKIQNTWNAVVSFARGRPQNPWIVDHLESGGREKALHDWQKTMTDMEYFIEKLTQPGALVVDPFAGSGTIPAACKKLGRQWLATEIEPQTAATARTRIRRAA
jgi:hypothetical protein